METYAVKVMRKISMDDPEYHDELAEVLSITGSPPVVAAALESFASEILTRHESMTDRKEPGR